MSACAQVTVVLSASSTAYSHDPRKAVLEPPLLLTGHGAALVSAVQVRDSPDTRHLCPDSFDTRCVHVECQDDAEIISGSILLHTHSGDHGRIRKPHAVLVVNILALLRTV